MHAQGLLMPGISAEDVLIQTAVCCNTAWYRNPLPKVKEFLDEHHRGHYKLYNLCCERSYDGALFNAEVEHFGFEDHQVRVSAVGSATLLSCLTLCSHHEEGLGPLLASNIMPHRVPIHDIQHPTLRLITAGTGIATCQASGWQVCQDCTRPSVHSFRPPMQMVKV